MVKSTGQPDLQQMKVERMENEPLNFKEPLSNEQLETIVQHNFGETSVIEEIKELGVGTFNNTYRVRLRGQPEMILRVAPAPGAVISSEEPNLMRREAAIYPAFAVVADLIPTIIKTDFTRHLLDRDYMFLSYLPGEVWSSLENELPSAAQAGLWREFGQLVKRINSVTGQKFGFPYPDVQFDSWSAFLAERLTRARADLQTEPDIARLDFLVSLIRSKAALLDEIKQPRLLHGDLWTFNLLIGKAGEDYRIVGLLDLDHALWGDPLADWTFFVLDKTEFSPEYPHNETFWQAYGGRPIASPGVEFRRLVYEALHACLILGWAGKRRDKGLEDQARSHLAAMTSQLQAYA